MEPPALLSDVGDCSEWGIGMNDHTLNVPVDNYNKLRFDDDDDDVVDIVYDADDVVDDDEDHHSIEKVDDLEDQLAVYFLYDLYRWEPIGSRLTRKYYNFTAPPYFKRDHPDDDLFLKQLGDAQLKYPNHADEPLIKDIVPFIIWRDAKSDFFWEDLPEKSTPDQVDSLYSDAIRGAAFLVYFLNTQANLFKIGSERTLEKQMDKIYTQLENWCQKGTPFDEACELLIQLIHDKDEFSFVTESHLGDMLCYYSIHIDYRDYCRPATVKDTFPPTNKDQLFEDISRVFREVELSPTKLKADEYTHWMMMLLREEVTQDVENLISQAIGDNRMVKLAQPSEDNNPMMKRARPSEETLLDFLFPFLLNLLIKLKDRMKRELDNVVQPLSQLCKLHGCKVCPEIYETIQVADLRRMSLGSSFIGRSHLIWAFYKLGYALPLKIRNMINIFYSDEDHPPYHIYKVALQLALLSGEKAMMLDHFIYAVIDSSYIDCFGRLRQMDQYDGEAVTEFYQDFKDYPK